MCEVTVLSATTPSYEEIINHVNANITTIIGEIDNQFEEKPVNGEWHAYGYGFTDKNTFYVDFEDGHSVFRALISCQLEEGAMSCNTLALFADQGSWVLIDGEDTQKDNSILYTWGKEMWDPMTETEKPYEWKRE